MFRRTQPPVVQPIAAPLTPPWRDKALPAIPFSPEWSQPTASHAAEDPSQSASAPKLRSDEHDLPLVILIEAEPRQQYVISDLARQWGYTVTAADNGGDRLQTFRAANRATIALVNHQTGGASGLHFCQAARALEKPPYTILVAERSGTERFGEALAAGADDYLITPFDADELRARLHVGARVIALQAQLRAGLQTEERADQ